MTRYHFMTLWSGAPV